MPHGKSPGYQTSQGSHWVECQVCGFDYREKEMRKRWDGLIVCPKDYELRQPQDFVRARQDKITPDGLINPPPAIVSTDTSGFMSQDFSVPGGQFCLTVEDQAYVEPDYWPADYVESCGD